MVEIWEKGNKRQLYLLAIGLRSPTMRFTTPFNAPCCGEPISAECCELAIERKAYAAGLIDAGLGKM